MLVSQTLHAEYWVPSGQSEPSRLLPVLPYRTKNACICANKTVIIVLIISVIIIIIKGLHKREKAPTGGPRGLKANRVARLWMQSTGTQVGGRRVVTPTLRGSHKKFEKKRLREQVVARLTI